MKKMMTNMKTLVALLMAGAAVTSCSSDSEIDSLKAPAGKTYTMTVQATKGGDAMTRSLADGGTTLTSTWSAGDKVKVYNSSDTELGELTAQSDGASTTLTGTLTTKPNNNETLTLKYLSPNYSTQDGTLTGFATSIDKVCDYATATVTATVDGDNVTTDAATFQHQQAVVKFTLKNSDASATLGATKLFVTADGNTYTVTPASAASELYVAVPAISAKQVTLTAKVGDTYYDFGKTSATFENGKFYRVTVKMTNGTLSGKFTINSSGDKVYFSKGNLQYDGTSWKFATNQYDVLGADGTKADGTAKKLPMDLFTWGNTSSSTEWGGTSYYTANANLSGTTDWGSNMGSGWRTLSKDEWKYVFGTNDGDKRSGATVGGTSNARYTEATINTDGTGVNGIILFPDGATFAAGEATWGTINAASAWGTQCTTAQWTALEAKGCVFLPAAGYRSGTSVYYVGSDGNYWSSTANGADFAYYVYFLSGDVYPADDSSRDYGFSVRLVHDAN